jgi:hypothetical protein
MSLLFDNEAVEISYNQEYHFVMCKWKGFATSERYREGLQKRLEAMHQYQCNCVLLENSLLRAVSPTDQQWVLEVHMPEAVSTLQTKMYISVVEAKDIFAKMAGEKLLPLISEFIESRIFDNLEDAEKWLISQ